MIKYLLFVLLLTFPLFSEDLISQTSNESTFGIQKVSYEIVPAPNNTYGYDIYLNNKLKIHQVSIPCISGIEGFKTKKLAEKVAKLIVEKIKNGIVPPSIGIEEMKRVKAI